MWDKEEFVFDEAAAGSEYYAAFTYLGGSSIQSVETSCSCSVASHTNKGVTVKYKAPAFPDHLAVLGIKQTVDVKTIKVKTADGLEKTLTIKAVLKKK